MYEKAEPASAEMTYSAMNLLRPSQISTCWPTSQRAYMLKATCSTEACTSTTVTSRHHSPAATAKSTSASARVTAGARICRTKNADRDRHDRAGHDAAGCSSTIPPPTVRAWRTVALPSRTHSGHWNPTAAEVMQSGQIGRSQRVQRTYVSRPGCL